MISQSISRRDFLWVAGASAEFLLNRNMDVFGHHSSPFNPVAASRFHLSRKEFTHE